MNSNIFKIKYEKYKSKYLSLKKQLGGECNPMPDIEEQNFNTFEKLSDLQPKERITIRGKCYNVRSLYKWIITDNNVVLPERSFFEHIEGFDELFLDDRRIPSDKKNLINEEERQALINAYRIL